MPPLFVHLICILRNVRTYSSLCHRQFGVDRWNELSFDRSNTRHAAWCPSVNVYCKQLQKNDGFICHSSELWCKSVCTRIAYYNTPLGLETCLLHTLFSGTHCIWSPRKLEKYSSSESMFVCGIRPGSSEEEEEEDVLDILQVCGRKSYNFYSYLLTSLAE